MEEKSLAVSFSNSLKEDTISCISDLAEVGLDTVMDNGILKEIPILSTAIAVYKIGNSIKERHNIKKLTIFLNEINKGIADKQKRQEYQKKINNNKNFRNQEIEYLFILIDRYISYDKSQMLAKLYLAYLDDMINFEDFTKYAEVIDRLLPGDKDYLLNDRALYRTISAPIPDSFIRLSSLGIFQEQITDIRIPTTVGSITIPAKQEKTYKLTGFGEKLQDILIDN